MLAPETSTPFDQPTPATAATDNNFALQMDKVGHHFLSGDRKVQLFENLSLTIESGQSVAITGPSGAGKSSLLALLAGLEQPTQGAIHCFQGERHLSINDLRKVSGFIFQQFHLLPELTALGNLMLPLRLRGQKGAESLAMDWLNRVGLASRSDHMPSQLSGGEQQRVAIARAFIRQPKFIFADEPTGNLDETTSNAITELMFGCAQQSKSALILVTHSHQLAAQADRWFGLSGGTLVERS